MWILDDRFNKNKYLNYKNNTKLNKLSYATVGYCFFPQYIIHGNTQIQGKHKYYLIKMRESNPHRSV